MNCACCGIKSNKTFCSDKCKQYGVDSALQTNRVVRTKYPYNDLCIKCGGNYERRNYGQKHCLKCRRDRSHINKKGGGKK